MTHTSDSHTDPAHVTVIGAGIMGSGIAYVAMVAGCTTLLIDQEPTSLSAAEDAITRDLQAAVTRGLINKDEASAASDRLETSTSLDASMSPNASIRHTDIVIEAVIEDLAVKHDVLGTAESLVDTSTILATNTSALSVTEIMSCLQQPSRGIGMHFFNPVPKMPLVEIVRGEQTDEATVATAARFAQTFGKQTVVVQDRPGFATSRVNALIGNEGMRMLEEGVASAEDIDKAVRLGLKHPMGPLEMGDLVGWDTRLAILEHLEATLGDRFRPTNLHRKLVVEGRFGRKSGHGIYRYDNQGNRLPDDTSPPASH